MKGRKPSRIYLILAAAVLLAMGATAAHVKNANKDQANLETSVAKRGTVVSSVSGNGVLQPVTTVEVKSNVGGQIVDLAVDEGDTVKAGQLIARIDPSDAQSTLDQAQADFSSSLAKVNQARQALSLQTIQGHQASAEFPGLGAGFVEADAVRPCATEDRLNQGVV